MIALALAASLLTVVFQFLISHARFSLQVEEAGATLREQQRLRERIDSFFMSLCPAADSPSFYTVQKEKQLHLLGKFDAGIDPDPLFSGPNRATLFVNEKQQLCFMQQPLEEERARIEVLLSDIRAIEWEFLGEDYKKDPYSTPIKGNWVWKKRWPKQSGGVPSVVRLSLWQGMDKKKQKEPNLQIAFILPFQEPIRIVKDT